MESPVRPMVPCVSQSAYHRSGGDLKWREVSKFAIKIFFVFKCTSLLLSRTFSHCLGKIIPFLDLNLESLFSQ